MHGILPKLCPSCSTRLDYDMCSKEIILDNASKNMSCPKYLYIATTVIHDFRYKNDYCYLLEGHSGTEKCVIQFENAL